MKVSDLDTGKLIEVINRAIFPVVFEGVDAQTPPNELRDRANLNSEIMGRIMGFSSAMTRLARRSLI